MCLAVKKAEGRPLRFTPVPPAMQLAALASKLAPATQGPEIRQATISLPGGKAREEAMREAAQRSPSACLLFTPPPFRPTTLPSPDQLST